MNGGPNEVGTSIRSHGNLQGWSGLKLLNGYPIFGHAGLLVRLAKVLQRDVVSFLVDEQDRRHYSPERSSFGHLVRIGVACRGHHFENANQRSGSSDSMRVVFAERRETLPELLMLSLVDVKKPKGGCGFLCRPLSMGRIVPMTRFTKNP